MEVNANKVLGMEKFINQSNIMGQPFVLKPGKSIVHLPVDFTAAERLLKDEVKGRSHSKRVRELPEFMRKEYEKLELFNYSPIPLLDLHKRQFLPLTRLQNTGDLYEG